VSELYRLVRKEPGKMRCFTASEFMNAKFAVVATDEDPHPKHRIYGEYYCHSDGCHVRQVEIRAKWESGDRPQNPKFNCPGCGKPLELLDYLETETLCLVEDAATLAD
jgi:hypothetical protein